MTLQLLHSEFPYICGKFYFIFYQCIGLCDPHCNENPIYVFLFWELRGLSPNFHIHVSVSSLRIPMIGPHLSCSRISGSNVGIYKSLKDTFMCL
jgi:hypothetical protein